MKSLGSGDSGDNIKYPAREGYFTETYEPYTDPALVFF